MGDQSEIRGSRSQWFAGKAVAVLMRVVGLTLRYRIEDPHGQKAKAAPGVPVIWIFWHNCLFSAPLTKKRFSGSAPASALASASKDGAVLESAISSFGVKTVRGSSSRRGVAALIALKKALKAGEQLFVTPDGPRGPRYELAARGHQAGTIFRRSYYPGAFRAYIKLAAQKLGSFSHSEAFQ